MTKEINKQDIESIISEENKHWDSIFSKEIANIENFKKFSSFWWEQYYKEMSVCVSKILVDYNNPRILEAGCGSGKATILLEPDCEKTLLDISPSALKYAKFLSDQFGAKNINYIQGDIFKMPFQSEEFDLVWNIGVLEHYDNKYIIDILCEMIRVTKRNGIISFGVPNSFSLPIIKAKILKYWFLRFIPGYRIHTDLIPGK